MAGLTLDSGALIDAERGGRPTVTLVKRAVQRGESITVPAGVLAQVWRGDRNARLALFLRNCVVEPLAEARAKRVGELLARSGTSDAIDASVVVSAASRGDAIVTSDPGDIRRLAAHAMGVAAVLTV
jgi:predicted nucleic acid-binding protein